MKVIITTGGRNYYNREVIHSAMDELLEQYGHFVLINGMASGADQVVRSWADKNDIFVVPVYADWERYGKGAGPIRNREMAAYKGFGDPSLLVAFPGGKGTENMIEVATKHNIPVKRVPDNEQ